MNKIAYSIMAHPKRLEYAMQLVRELKCPVSLDDGRGLWENAKTAWCLNACSTNEISFVIQDDAILCDNFKEKVQQLVDYYPNHAYCLYVGANLKTLRGKYTETVVHNRVHWGIALGIPTKHIEPFLEFGDRFNDRYGSKHSDTRLCRYCRKVGLKVVYPYPSLVDHRQLPSLVGDSIGRKAYIFK